MRRGARESCVFKTSEIPSAMDESERHAPLAQLNRASGYGPEGRGFESLTAYQSGMQAMMQVACVPLRFFTETLIPSGRRQDGFRTTTIVNHVLLFYNLK